jgi:hypothetical protein
MPEVIGVHRRDEVASAFCYSPIPGCRHAAILLLDKTDAAILSGVTENSALCVVTRAVVDYDDLERVMRLGADAGESPIDGVLGIKSRNDNADKRQPTLPPRQNSGLRHAAGTLALKSEPGKRV